MSENKHEEHSCGCSNGNNHEHNGGCGCGNDHEHDHGCGCGHDHDDVQMMHLVLDDDTELNCYVLGIFEVRSKEYIALVPENEETVLLYEYTETEEGAELGNIQSDEDYELVSKAFDEIFNQEYDEEE
ncbi:UPF0473 family protein [Gottschalkia purinilytica]|uniref:UPF0473 family protein n=1 Tax=Gottschalkia purinilytica TaxID=1503 RepID=A0A0L0WFI6_GOTPU|nr:DUF1292 domain-containing protein [Gottschalkia purinilytica]KNF10185.1 UPF0473 family protein [Gottschalkia purinilytica]